MVLRPQGLLPERRRNLEFSGEAGVTDTQLAEPSSMSGGAL
jgi:hypothetical protein